MPKTLRVDPTAPELEIFRAKSNSGQTVGTIAMCTRDKVSAGTVVSWLMSDRSSFLKENENIGMFIIQGHVLTLQRNESVARMDGDWIIFVDDDMTWQPDAFRRLIEAQQKYDADMIGALCFQRSAPYQPTLYMRESPTEGRYVFLEDWEDGDVVEVDATGLAMVLITKRLLTRIAGRFPSKEERDNGRPPAYFRWDERGFGEDLTFCQDAKLAGARILVDTSIKTGHVSEISVTHETFLGQMAQRPDDITELRRVINDGLGLPTLDAEQAAKKLETLSGVG